MRLRNVSRVTLAALGLCCSAAVLFGACGDTRGPCEKVTCSAGRVCDPATGACLPGDGGTGGGGGGGTGGGGGADSCDPACQAPQKCDSSTHSCVECLSNADCSCPTPRCSVSRVCVAEDPDAGAVVALGGETCAAAPVFSSCTGLTRFTVDLSSAKDDLSASCGGVGGGDLAWLVTLAQPADLRVTATPSSGSSAQPVVSVRHSCDPGSELGCSDALGGSSRVLLKSRAAGNYLLIIDNFDSAPSGPVEVVVELLAPTEPANETCGTALPLTLGAAPITVDTSAALDDVQVDCNTITDSPDVVYSLTLAATTDVQLTAVGLDAGVDAVLALRSSPCTGGTLLGCSDLSGGGGSEQLRLRGLDAGTYFVVVESYGRDSAGLTSVQATVAPPAPSNDSCAAPRVLSFPPGVDTLTFTVDTSAASDDTTGSCNVSTTAPRVSPEVVYQLELGAARTVTVTSGPSGGSNVDAVIYLRSGSCDTGQELACDDGYPTDTLTQSLSAGTYFLFVEAYSTAWAGPTEVTVTLAP